MEAIETIEHRGLTITMHYYDPHADHPRDRRESLAKIHHWSDYEIPDSTEIVDPLDQHYGGNSYNGRDVYERALRIFAHAVAVERYEVGDWSHGFGHVGFAFITREVAEREGLTDPAGYLRSEIAEDRAYFAGDVYGYNVTDVGGKHVDSCWGFYGQPGYDYAIERAKEEADHYADERDARMAAHWTILDAIFGGAA